MGVLFSSSPERQNVTSCVSPVPFVELAYLALKERAVQRQRREVIAIHVNADVSVDVIGVRQSRNKERQTHTNPSSLEASEPSIRSSGRPATKHKIGRSKETYVNLRNTPELATANRTTRWDARSRGMGL